MQCRNCQHYLDDEFRYCPRCGTPRSLGWPAAGGPWLRRPAVVAGLALLLVAWLAALQRQLWVSGRPPAASLSNGQSQIAARSLESRPVFGSGVENIPAFATPHSSQHRSPLGKRVRHHSARSSRSATVRIAAVPPHARHPRRSAGAHRRTVQPDRENPGAGTFGTEGQIILASYKEPLRPPVDRGAPRLARSPRRPPSGHPKRTNPWSEAPVLVKSHAHYSAEPVVHPSNLVVNISARPYGAKTWVYLNGVTELGSTPLRARFPHPGRYRLLFFAPTLGSHGRVYRTVQVTGQSRQWVSAIMGPSREFARY